MNQETIEELRRLLDAGEPLLTKFPIRPDSTFLLLLPDGVTEDMEWYANEVSFRANTGRDYPKYGYQISPDFLPIWLERSKAGLLGWCSIGVLKQTQGP